MQTYNITSAKANLSDLVEKAAKDEAFVTAKDGKPMVKVIAFDAPEPTRMRRFGFMPGQIKVPKDFNTMGAAEIVEQFEGTSLYRRRRRK